MSRTYRNPLHFGYSSAENYYKNCQFCYRYGDLKEAKKEYAKASRDGALKDGSSKKVYRDYANMKIRSKNRIDLQKLKRDLSINDNQNYADHKDGKHYAWAIW